MLDEAINFGVPEAQDNEVSLPTPGDIEQPLSPEAASARAAKTNFAQVIPEKTTKDFYQQYLEGKESMLRKEAATRADFDGVMARNKALSDLANKKQGPLSRNEVERVLDTFRPADPRSVIERAYADKFVSSVNTARGFMRDSMLDTARLELGDQGVDKTLEYASDLLAKNQYIYNRVQKAEEKVQAQSLVGYGADFGKTLFQPYMELKQRGLIGSALSNWGLGSVKDTQHSLLYDMPMGGTFESKFDAAMDLLEKDNPQLAVSWGKSMLGQAQWESRLDNVFTGMMPLDYYGIAKGGVRAFTTKRQVEKAAKDMVEAASKDPTFQPKTVAEGAGDLHEAAVQGVTVGLNPMEKAESSLMSTWWTDAKKFVSNSGTYLSREATTRLNDFVDQGRDIFGRLGTMNRVERAQESVLSPEVNRIRMEQIKQQYKGPQNTLLDIEGPVREPESGTYWFKAKIGNYDASQFPDVATAQGFARQIGLADPVIKGTEATKLYLPEAAAKNLESIKTTEQGTKFYLDNSVEVIPSTRPEPGMVPYNLKTGQFEKTLTKETTAVEQQGLGFHIEHWIPLKETDDLTRDTMIKNLGKAVIRDAVSTNSASGGESLKNSVLGWVRNSDDTMSVNESAQRKAATYAQANIHMWAKQLTRDLEDIRNGRVRYDELTGEEIPGWKVWAKNYLGGKLKGRQINEEFTRTLNHAREVEGFFENPGQLQDWYQRNFKRDPSYLETKAYFNFVKLVEGDRMMMELSEFRNRARQGAEQISLTFRDAKTNEAMKSKFFDAIPLKTFPNSTDNYILVMGKNKGDEVLHEIGAMDSKRVKAMTDKIIKGEAKAYMVYDETHMPLNGFADVAKDKLIRFVYTEGQAESKALDFNHVTRRGGGHFEWDYDWYLKQADVRPQYATGLNNKISGLKNFYVGDITLMPIKNRAMGADVAKLFNEAHELIKAGKWDEVKPIAAKLGIKWDEFTSWYHPGRDADGNPTRPRLNPHEPIVVVARNRKIMDMDEAANLVNRYRFPHKDDPTKFKETLVDKTKAGPDNNFKVQYNQERNSTFDMRTINDIGTQGNPVYAHQPSSMVDPLETMNRALSRMINSTFMDDYKLYHVEHWLREAEPHLNATPNEIRANPFAWYSKPEWRSGVEKHIISNLMSNRMKGQQFVGTPSKFDTWVQSATSHLADGFYTKYGPEESRSLGQKAITIAPIWALQHLEDPVSFMRSVTFNFKLGLMAVPQFIVQAQTHSLIWALEPRHGTVGTYGTLLHAWGSFTSNPKILEHLDEAATKLNILGSKWRKGEWLEARKELANSGFEHVAGEYANLNNQLKTRFILNDFEKGLKVGQYPFRLGEQSTRLTAWYTAFREFRDANPTAVIGNVERSKILAKADLLTVNMSRASSSALNHGVFSLSTQFLTYQIKLAELFWGKRLGENTLERNLARARMLTFFTAMYGLPNAIGVTGAPFSENLREHFMDDLGYIPGEKWLSTMMNEGLPAWQMAMITGKLPNFGDRFGSQGFQNIKQGLNGSIPWWQAVGGASVSTFSNFIGAALDPYTQYGMSWLRGDRTDDRFSIKAADLAEPLKEISSVSTGAKWWTAIQTGLWVSKNEQTVTDVTPWQATLYGLTGMSPQEQDDMFINNKMIQGEKDAKKKALKEFIKDWRRGIEAMNNNDPEQGHSYKRNAIARAKAAGFDTDELAKAMAIGSRVEKAIDSSNYQRFMQGDYNKRDERKEYFRRQLQMKDNQ